MKLVPLARAFFDRPVLAVARDLIGQLLVRTMAAGDAVVVCVGRIAEAEAYAGRVDPASHSFRGPTPRTRTMFGPVGHAYVYFTYGNHFCVNVVAGPRSLAGAVLLRAIEPQLGVQAMRAERARRTRAGDLRRKLADGRADHELASGPGKLTAALAIDRTLDGIDITQRGLLYLAQGDPAADVLWTPRVGLGTNPAAPWRWRCIDARSPHVTRVPAAWPRAPRPSPSLAQVARACFTGGR